MFPWKIMILEVFLFKVSNPLNHVRSTLPDPVEKCSPRCQIKRMAGEWKQTVQADVATVATVTHLGSWKAQIKLVIFNREKQVPEDFYGFLFSCQSSFQGWSKWKTFHTVLLDCHEFDSLVVNPLDNSCVFDIWWRTGNCRFYPCLPEKAVLLNPKS